MARRLRGAGIKKGEYVVFNLSEDAAVFQVIEIIGLRIVVVDASLDRPAEQEQDAGGAWLATEKQIEHTHAMRHAREAGNFIRFFLEGGNDCVFENNDHVAGMVLSKLNALLPNDVHRQLCLSAGYEWKRDRVGYPTLHRIEETKNDHQN